MKNGFYSLGSATQCSQDQLLLHSTGLSSIISVLRVASLEHAIGDSRSFCILKLHQVAIFAEHYQECSHIQVVMLCTILNLDAAVVTLNLDLINWYVAKIWVL